jgi:hypothetical protein
MRYLRFKLPPNTQLSLPVETSIPDPSTGARETLVGSTLRTWMGTWALASDRSAEIGLFEMDLRRLILDVFAMPAEATTVKGKKYWRAPRKIEMRVREDVELLSRTMLCGFGSKTFEPPQPLIQRYVVRDEATGRRWENFYLHAPFAWAEARYNFVQLPTAALRLDAHQSDLVLGIANVLRNHAQTWLKSGSLSLSLEEMAREAGQPVDPGVRRGGMAYWTKLRERLAKVFSLGGFGDIHFGTGEGCGVSVTVEPVEPLAIVYSSLLATAERRRSESEVAAFEARVRQLLPTAATKRRRRQQRPAE